MARTIGVKRVYLMRNGAETWTLVDDYRPAGTNGIDRRYAEYNAFGGMIWYQDTRTFEDASEGNDFYLSLVKDGYKVCTEGEVRRLKDRAARMTY